MNEKALEAMMARQAYLEEAEDVRLLVARSNEKGCALRPCEDISLATDDPVILYLAVEFQRYWAEGIRTFVYGMDSFIESGESVRSLYNQVTAGHASGKEISRFCKEAVGLAASARVDLLPEYGLGQGIGLGLQESPLISDAQDSPFKDGMCLALRLAVKNGEAGFAMTGETIYLSPDGPKVLTRL